MTKIKRLSILITCAFFGCLVSKAQDTTNTIGKVSIASPNAASLGKYGDIPVSYHTGLPQISVPIYTVESGSLKLPISLSYHASGLKVQEQASWVGAGWSLNAGGMITRSVVGAPDDRGYASLGNVIKGHYSDYGFNNYNATEARDDAHFSQGAYDGEPDLYFFNFGSYSGKFYYNDDRTPILVPQQDFKIQTSYTSGPGFTGFIITTPDGVRYYFGQTGNTGPTNPIETTIPSTINNGPANQSGAASSWFLNKILSADGTDSISLQYQPEIYSYYTLGLSPVVYYKYVPTDGTKIGINLVKNFVSGIRLTQISFPNGTVNLTRSSSPRTDLAAGTNVSTTMNDLTNTNAYSLGSISIKNLNGFCKKDSFYYGYFLDNTALSPNFFTAFYTGLNLHSDKYRLRLDSVRESSCDVTIKLPPYKFSYFPGVVPRKLSFGIDHWGYYNGNSANATLVPTYIVNTNGSPTTFTGANRDASWPEMRGGALQTITYPTGGSTTFDCEPKNIYTSASSTPQQVPLAGYIVNEDGQSQLTHSVFFNISVGGVCVIDAKNHSTNWSPTFSINSAGVQKGTWLISVSGALHTTLSLPPGTYQGTLSFPSNSQPGLINGADALVSQWQDVPTQTSFTVSGLRIKTITNKDAITPNDIVTSYNYNAGQSTSTAVLYSIPTYVQSVRNNNLALVWPYPCQMGCLSCNGYTYFVSPSSVQPMATTQGENAGYNEVDVSQTGNGHSVYRYYESNFWSTSIVDVCKRYLFLSGNCDNTIPDFPAPPVPFEFLRGELSYEGHFSQTGQLLKESYYFPVYTPDKLTTPGHIAVNMQGLYSYTEYAIQSAAKTQNKVIERIYDPGTANSITTTNTVYYGSPYHHQPTRKVTSTSTGDSLVTNIKYAFDFRLTGCDNAIPDSLRYYQNAVHADSVSMYHDISLCSPQASDGTNCRISIFTTFRQNISRDRVKFINYRRRSYSESINLLNTCYKNALSTADTLLKPILRLQNEYYNAPIESNEWKDLNLLHASYTRFDTSISPLGYVYPARTKLINLQAPTTTFTNASVSGNTIAKDNRYADESFYNFTNSNPVQVTARDGIANSYIWDYLGSQPIAKVSNAPVTQIAYTSFEANGRGNWTFAGTPVADATSPTGAKCYPITSGNITKSGLTSSTSYVFSFWQKAGSSFSLKGGTYTSKTGKTINGWTYYEDIVTGATALTVSGTGYIDELRLYPRTAQMTTYTYTPLVGVTSACDVDNKITYYFYDGLGRLKWIKDQDLNVIKTIQYHYSGIPGIQ